jgi:alanyl-tRNA synthetase
LSITKKIEEIVGKFYKGNEKEMRIIADHVRAAGALIKEGVEPSNKLQGYVLRRLIRRSAVKMRGIKGKVEINDLNLGFDEKVTKVIEEEVGRFKVSLERGMKLLESQEKVDGKQAFDLFQSYGFPFEVTQEIAEERGQKIDEKEFKEEYRKHQEKSRAASGGMFKGGLADHSEEVMRLHTVTHLLHEALRRVLGEQVSQKGSNITKERARFDFTHDKKLTEDEIAKVEKLINEQIEKKWPVTSEVMGLEEAKKKGALAFSWLRRQVGEKYGEKVKVYSINNFSKEVCGGPHVKNLGEIEGRVRIKKEESVSSGVRRIYAAIEK